MSTVTVVIENSNDDLSQGDWSVFIDDVEVVVFRYTTTRYFFGTLPSTSPFRQACWVFECLDSTIEALHKELVEAATPYRQDTIHVVTGVSAWLACGEFAERIGKIVEENKNRPHVRRGRPLRRPQLDLPERAA